MPPRNPLKNAYFGELHVHTSWSLDAFSNGNREDGPTVAYRYGRGEPVTTSNGARFQLRVPLDFMAVTDHDNYFGETQLCASPGDPVYDTQVCRDLRSGQGLGPRTAFLRVWMTSGENRHLPEICGTADAGRPDTCFERATHVWHEIQKNADAFYQPGRFTTFTAFEWTGQPRPPNGPWLHRNVIFRGGRIPEWGGSAIDMKHSPERLWEWLERACTDDCQVLAIPHNTNYGQGLILAPHNSDGTPFTKEILARRAKAEPLIEVHQIKGNSECAPGLGTTDEDCNFEQSFQACKPGQQDGCAFASDYVRNALKTGLNVEADFGVNPFKYGIIASTDAHSSNPGTTDEKTWSGVSSSALAATVPGGEGQVRSGPGNNPGGLAGVWAEANSREAIFDALKRRETFATSGSRIRVRFFGGWTYSADLHGRRDLVTVAYASGVPMGSDLPSRPGAAKGPRFVVWATKDPDLANLQKIQVIKGWAAGGKTFERVYDVVCSDGLTANPATGRCPDNGATVNLADCQSSTTRGAAVLSTTWTDPDFNPSDRAFYYARVLENPTCRWTTYRALVAGSRPSDPAAAVIQERAWSSPIWYTPSGR